MGDNFELMWTVEGRCLVFWWQPTKQKTTTHELHDDQKDRVMALQEKHARELESLLRELVKVVVGTSRRQRSTDMTTPTGATDERERLQVLLAKYIGDSKYLLPVFEATNILHAMSADAETIFELQTRISCRDADIDVMQEELAAQSAELERVRKGRKQVGYLITWNNPMYRGPQTISFDPCDDDDGTCVPVYTLAAPSAAGGEKEG